MVVKYYFNGKDLADERILRCTISELKEYGFNFRYYAESPFTKNLNLKLNGGNFAYGDIFHIQSTVTIFACGFYHGLTYKED